MMECCNCLINSSEESLVMYNDQFYCEECMELMKYPLNYRQIRNDFESFITDMKANNEESIFALSGGKDSVVALKILVQNYDVRPKVFTVDHGFKNKLIMENCMSIVQRYRLDWYISRVEREVIDEIKMKASCGDLPCIHCNNLWKNKKFYDICQKFNIKYLFTGGDTPVNGSAVFKKEQIPGVIIGMPLVPEKFTEDEIYKQAFDIGWVDPQIEGLDTDCIAVGIALENYRRNTGRGYHIEEKRHLSQKTRYGIMTKEYANEILTSKKNVSEKEVEFFENV